MFGWLRNRIGDLLLRVALPRRKLPKPPPGEAIFHVGTVSASATLYVDRAEGSGWVFRWEIDEAGMAAGLLPEEDGPFVRQTRPTIDVDAAVAQLKAHATFASVSLLEAREAFHRHISR